MGKRLLRLAGQVSTEQLKEAVESRHGGTAKFVQSVAVHEEDDGQTIWDGHVHVFDLRGHPDGAFRVYAWCFEREDGNRRFFSILHSPMIYSPVLAIRAAILAKLKGARMVEPSFPAGRLTCPRWGQSATWAADQRGGNPSQEGFHGEQRPGLGRVVVCDQCDEIVVPGGLDLGG